jgi:hypothetical protein
MKNFSRGKMFNKVLIPISSEYYGKHVLKRGEFLANQFNSKIDLVYIIEEKTLNQTDKISDTYRTPFEKEETKKEIIRKQMLAADNIVFNDAEFIFKHIPFEKKIVEGEFTSIVKSELKKKEYDLIVMGFEKECLLNYRLLDDIDIPVWIVAKSERQSILAVCSNLAPNKKVPEISMKLSEALGWKLHMIYVVDTEDNVQVDENGARSDKKPENVLLYFGQEFTYEMKKKKINVDVIKGSLEKETIKAAEKIKPKLVILGREQKKKGPLGIPIKNLKKKLAKKCEYSILFVN